MLRIVLPAVFLFVGCGQMSAEPSTSKNDSGYFAGEADTETAALDGDEFNSADKSAEAPMASKRGASQETARKIIYTANVELAVEEFSDKPADVKKLVEKHGGFVAGSRLSAESGSNRSGHWKLRIPVKQFDAFLEEAKSLGELIDFGTDSREVTEEFYDVQARIKNKEIERDRLQALLENKDRVAKLKDVLDVERELARVQGELEQYQGRMRRLENLTSLTTIELNIRQIRNFVPEDSATFGTLARRSFEDSWVALKRTGQTVVLALIALAIWLPLIIVGLLVLRFGWKRLRADLKVAGVLKTAGPEFPEHRQWQAIFGVHDHLSRTPPIATATSHDDQRFTIRD